MSRRTVIAVCVILFLVVSVELGRYLSASGTERNKIFELLEDEARGDSAAVMARLKDCAADARCRRVVETRVPKLRHAGDVKILLMESKTAYKPWSSTGFTRVAWATLDPAGPTVVQCVTVRKNWNFLSGASTSLLTISAPIGLEASC